MKFFKKNKKGFTLVELIVVIAILGVLTAIVVPRVVASINAADISHDRATLRTVQEAVNMFRAQHGRFPGRTVAGAYFTGYVTGDNAANYLALATGTVELSTPSVTHNLQAHLSLGTPPAMPAARSRDGATLRVFHYNPETGLVTVVPALPAP